MSDIENNILDAGAAKGDPNSRGSSSFKSASSLSQVRSPCSSSAAPSNSGVGGRVQVSLESENSNVGLKGGVPGGEFGNDEGAKLGARGGVLASKISSWGDKGGVFASG